MALPATDDFSVNNFAVNWTAVVGSFDTNSGQGRSLSANENVTRWTADSFNADHYAQAKLQTQSYPGVCVRLSGASLGALDGYAAVRRVVEGNVRIYRFDNGVASQVGGDYGAVSDSTVVKLQATGTTLELFYDGASQGTETDSAYSSGAAGLYGFDGSGFDDFQADNVSAGSTPSPAAGALTLTGQAASLGFTFCLPDEL
jgi:hypothetical protein